MTTKLPSCSLLMYFCVLVVSWGSITAHTPTPILRQDGVQLRNDLSNTIEDVNLRPDDRPTNAAADGDLYTSAYTPVPKLSRNGKVLCHIPLFDKCAFATWNTVHVFQYDPVALSCDESRSDHWGSVFLDVRVEIDGLHTTQYDRTIGLWIGGVAAFRGTTQEPTNTRAQEEVWEIEKHLTEYKRLLTNPQEVMVSINGLVNAHYNGSYLLTASLSAYSGTIFRDEARDKSDTYDKYDGTKSYGATPYVVAPFDPTRNGKPLTDLMQTATNATRTFRFPDGGNIRRAVLDVIAQPQATDEFYYSNVLDRMADKTGMLGGGSWRIVTVYIDGLFAGCFPVAPVVFSGGMNPYLWRPLTGIRTLDLPSVRLDITPFVGMLNHHSTNHHADTHTQTHTHIHNITLSVNMNTHEKNTFWLMEVAVVMYPCADDCASVSGSPPIISAPVPVVVESGAVQPMKPQRTDGDDQSERADNPAGATTGTGMGSGDARYNTDTGSEIDLLTNEGRFGPKLGRGQAPSRVGAPNRPERSLNRDRPLEYYYTKLAAAATEGNGDMLKDYTYRYDASVVYKYRIEGHAWLDGVHEEIDLAYSNAWVDVRNHGNQARSDTVGRVKHATTSASIAINMSQSEEADETLPAEDMTVVIKAHGAVCEYPFEFNVTTKMSETGIDQLLADVDYTHSLKHWWGTNLDAHPMSSAGIESLRSQPDVSALLEGVPVRGAQVVWHIKASADYKERTSSSFSDFQVFDELLEEPSSMHYSFDSSHVAAYTDQKASTACYHCRLQQRDGQLLNTCSHPSEQNVPNFLVRSETSLSATEAEHMCDLGPTHALCKADICDAHGITVG